MLAIHLLTLTKTNMVAQELMRHLRVNYKAAWRIRHKITHAMTEREAPSQSPLSPARDASATGPGYDDVQAPFRTASAYGY